MNLLTMPLNTMKNIFFSKNKIKKSKKLKALITNGLLILINNRHKLYLKKQKAPFNLKLDKHY